MEDTMYQALNSCLPDHEPPMAFGLDEVVRAGRRERLRRQVTPVIAIVAAVVSVVLVLLGLAGRARLDPAPGPPPGRPSITLWPTGEVTSTLPPSATSAPASPSAASGRPDSSASASGFRSGVRAPAGDTAPGPTGGMPPASPAPEVTAFVMPDGYGRDPDMQRFADGMYGAPWSQPMRVVVAAHSTQPANGAAVDVFHAQYVSGGRYAYAYVHLRRLGPDQGPVRPPSEPCLDRVAPVPASVACRYEINQNGDQLTYFDDARGPRHRGVVKQVKDGGPRITWAMWAPAAGGAWPSVYPGLAGRPPVSDIPMTWADFAAMPGL